MNLKDYVQDYFKQENLVDKKDNPIAKCPDIIKEIKALNNADYVNNVWDKGHLAPVGSIRCNKDMVHATFTYVNCTLQHERLNRGVWKTLEAREQQLAQQHPEVYVTIRVVFDTNPTRLATNADIPKGFYKTITYGNVTEKYYFPNIDPVSKDINYYKCK